MNLVAPKSYKPLSDLDGTEEAPQTEQKFALLAFIQPQGVGLKHSLPVRMNAFLVYLVFSMKVLWPKSFVTFAPVGKQRSSDCSIHCRAESNSAWWCCIQMI